MKLADVWESKSPATSAETSGGGLLGMFRKQQKGQCNLSKKRGECTK